MFLVENNQNIQLQTSFRMIERLARERLKILDNLQIASGYVQVLLQTV